jgi:hypothetical protein
MPITINGTTGIAGVDGSASTPSLQGADTNTGMFFPAADTIAFAEGGAEVMRIDSAGNVGIGTTSPTNFGSNFKMLAVQGSDFGVMQAISSSGSTTLEMMGASGVGYVGTRTNHPLVLRTNDTEQMRITTAGLLQFNSGYGSVATAYGCRAWVNFNGTGTPAIRASGNVSSITDNGTGLYTVNFTTAMPDTSYTTVGSSIGSTTSSDGMILTGTAGGAAPTTSAVQVRMAYAPNNTVTDITFVNVAVFR